MAGLKLRVLSYPVRDCRVRRNRVCTQGVPSTLTAMRAATSQAPDLVFCLCPRQDSNLRHRLRRAFRACLTVLAGGENHWESKVVALGSDG
jgi:hypothetical protein